MRSSAVTALLLATIVGLPAWAQSVVETYQTDLDRAWAEIEEEYGYYGAPGTLAEAFTAHGVDFSMRYTEAWGGWVYLDLDRISGFYHRADRAMFQWQSAVNTGAVTEAQAATALAAPMAAFHAVDALIQERFVTSVHYVTQRGLYLDAAQSVEFGSNMYYAYIALADEAGVTSDEVIPNFVRDLEVIPLPGAPLADLEPVLRQLWPAHGQSPRAMADAFALIELQLAAAGVPMTDPVHVAAAVAERFYELQAPDVPGLLDAAAQADPALRAVLLRRAEATLLEQAGEFAPYYAHDLIQSGDYGAEDVSALASLAQRLIMLRDDFQDPTSAPSPALRVLSGLHAAAEILEMRETPPEAREVLSVFNDLGTITAHRVPVTSAFALQSGVVAGQLETTRQGFLGSADALDGISRAMQGDPNGLADAQAAARRVEAALDPRNIVDSMVRGAAEGFVSLVPGARSLLADFLS